MAVVRVFNNELEAEVAMSALEAAGIACVMRRDDCGGVQPAMGLVTGIKVEVPDDDLDTATEVLDAEALNAEDVDGPVEG